MKLFDALKATFDVEREPTDVVRLEQNYAAPHLFDVVVEDTLTGETHIFPLFDALTGTFVGFEQDEEK